jgi:hypothetical protein
MVEVPGFQLDKYSRVPTRAIGLLAIAADHHVLSEATMSTSF